RRRHTRLQGDWSSDVCSSDLKPGGGRTTPISLTTFPYPLHFNIAASQTDPTAHRNDLVCSVGFTVFVNGNARSSTQEDLPCQPKIGRASCRERVESRVLTVAG